MTRERFESIVRAQRCGLSYEDAVAVRRIALTLHRWFELECGDSNDYQSWCIVRGSKSNGVFTYAKDGTLGKPYMETHYHQREAKAHYYPVADRETGARKRLDKIMSRYPALRAWIQTDPRGVTIYLCKPEDATDSLYTRGVFIA
jgi:hypothetical protein